SRRRRTEEDLFNVGVGVLLFVGLFLEKRRRRRNDGNTTTHLNLLPQLGRNPELFGTRLTVESDNHRFRGFGPNGHLVKWRRRSSRDNNQVTLLCPLGKN